jgi:hypothetical protein
VPGQGTYTLDPATGEVTFVAALGYLGTATAVTYRVSDAYGQTADATFTPTVTLPPPPEPPAKTSTGRDRRRPEPDGHHPPGRGRHAS